MPRLLPTILVLAFCVALIGCENMYASKPKSAMIIANHTDQPIIVAYTQSPDNTTATAYTVDQRVAPAASIRFGGQMGDELTITVGDEPPMLLPFARRNQVVKVSEDSGEVSYNIRKGYTDPTKE